tara:strand:+ start:48 stop:287 length:240 start_codon:yes stop_codon:yes gene_type:complete
MLKNIIKRNMLHKNSLKHIRFFNDKKLPSVISNNNYIENYNIEKRDLKIGSKSELKEDRIKLYEYNGNLNKDHHIPKNK